MHQYAARANEIRVQVFNNVFQFVSCPLLSTIAYRIISAIRPHITAENTLTGRHIYVGRDEAADFGVVVAGGEIVEAGFGIVVVAAITERVVCAKCSCQGAGGGYQLAPRIVDIFYHTHAAFV